MIIKCLVEVWITIIIDTHQTSSGQLVHSDSGFESQILQESQQSETTKADDREDADTIDYKSPASTPPPPSVDPLFPLSVDGNIIGNNNNYNYTY